MKVVKSTEEVCSTAKSMIGMQLVTHQTGPEGKEVKRVYIEEGCDIARELYLGAIIDRAKDCVTFMASTEGGMEIEEVAEADAGEDHPALSASIRRRASMAHHCQDHRVRPRPGRRAGQVGDVKFLTGACTRRFTDTGRQPMVEINPLVVTGSGDVIALDAKMNFDDNALYPPQEYRGAAGRG